MKLTMKIDSAKTPYDPDVITFDTDVADLLYPTCTVTVQPKDGPPAVAVVSCAELRRMVKRLP